MGEWRVCRGEGREGGATGRDRKMKAEASEKKSEKKNRGNRTPLSTTIRLTVKHDLSGERYLGVHVLFTVL